MDLDSLYSFDDRASGLQKPKTRKQNAFLTRAKKKPKKTDEDNRHRLDLDPATPKIRAEAEEDARRTSFHRAVTAVAIMVLAALSYVSVKQSVWANPAFSLRHLYVYTEGMLTPNDIATETGLRDGVNLLTIDLAVVRDHVLKLHGVKSASVVRDFSGRLELTVNQRQPIAWLRSTSQGWDPSTAGAGLLVDEEGYAIPCTNRLPAYNELPVIDHEEIPQIVKGAVIKDERFHGALKLVKAMSAREAEGKEGISYVRVKSACSLETQLKKSGLVAIFSWDNFQEELSRYDLLAEANPDNGLRLETINFMAETHLPAKIKPTPKLLQAIKISDATPTHSRPGSPASANRSRLRR